MGRVILLVLSFAITVFAMADCARTPSEELPAKLPKALWLLVILLFTPIGGIAWIIISRVTQAEARGGQLNRGIWYSETPAVSFPSRQRTETPIDAPDNDPEFLWKLEKELQRKRREQETASTSEAEGSATGEPPLAGGVNNAEPGTGAGDESGGASSGMDSSGDTSEIDELDPFANGDPDEDLDGEPDGEPDGDLDGERPTGSPQ